MWNQFILEHLHFAINVFGTLAFFCVFWLHWDAWKDRKSMKGFFPMTGFFLLSISFLIHATTLESTVITSPLFPVALTQISFLVLRTVGYLFLIVGIFMNPVTKRPQDQVTGVFSAPSLLFVSLLQPILAGLTGYLYLRKATVGLEHHLKRIGIAFFILSIAEVLHVVSLFHDSTNVELHQIAAPFGPIWIIQHVILLLSFIVFAQWGFSYLFKRFETQLFMVFTSVTLVIFLVTTISFTALLLKNIEKNTYSSLEDDSKMLLFTLESKTSETLSDAQVLSGNPEMENLISDEDKRPLKSLTESFLLSKKENSLLVLDSKGIVVARGEDRERVGDSFSSDPIIKSALLGKEITSLVTKEGALSPIVQIVAASPIKSKEGSVVGVVVAVNTIDHTFLDRVKTATGFEVGIYGGEYLSTTSVKPFTNSNERAIGIKESNQEVKDHVLAKGEEYVGHVNFLSSSYMASYLPLKDSDNTIIGMLFVGTPEVALLQTASRSIEITFIETVVLLVLSVVPSYLISRAISKQL